MNLALMATMQIHSSDGTGSFVSNIRDTEGILIAWETLFFF